MGWSLGLGLGTDRSGTGVCGEVCVLQTLLSSVRNASGKSTHSARGRD